MRECPKSVGQPLELSLPILFQLPEPPELSPPCRLLELLAPCLLRPELLLQLELSLLRQLLALILCKRREQREP